MNALQALSLSLFINVLGWSKEEVEVLIAGVRKDLRNPHIHGYWRVWVFNACLPHSTVVLMRSTYRYTVYGQKPEWRGKSLTLWVTYSVYLTYKTTSHPVPQPVRHLQISFIIARIQTIIVYLLRNIENLYCASIWHIKLQSFVLLLEGAMARKEQHGSNHLYL